MPDLPRMLTPDTIPVFLKQLGIPLVGDAELNLLAGMIQRPCDQISTTDVSTAVTDMGFSTDDASVVTDALVTTGLGVDS